MSHGPDGGFDAPSIEDHAFRRIGTLVRESARKGQDVRHFRASAALCAALALAATAAVGTANLHEHPPGGSQSWPRDAVGAGTNYEDHAMAIRRAAGVGVVAASLSGAALGQNGVLDLDAGGWVQIAHHVSQHPSAELTIEFWVKAQPNSVGRPISKRPGDSGCYSIEFYPLTSADGSARITAASFFGTCGNGGSMFTPVGQWVHVAYVLKAGEATRYYLNGVMREQLAQGPCALSAGTHPLAFGRTPGYPETQFYGRLDNVRLWSQARSAAQIAASALTEYDGAQAASTPDLIGSWSFDDGTAADARGVNSGTLQQGARIVVDDAPGATSDCNGSGVLDAYEIATGVLSDGNSNGVPDCCEAAPICLPCAGDVDGNGEVNGVDLAAILAAWGTTGAKYPGSDANRDGAVNGGDLAQVLSDWGPCR